MATPNLGSQALRREAAGLRRPSLQDKEVVATPLNLRHPLRSRDSGAGGELHQAVDRVAEDEHPESQRGVLLVRKNRANQEQNGGHQRDSGEPGVAPSAIRAPQFRLPFSQGENGSVGKRVIGHEEKRKHGNHTLERPDHENDARNGAEEQSDGWRAPWIYFRGLAEEQAIGAHGIKRPGAEKLIGVEAAQHGNDHDRTNDGIAEAAKHAIGNGSEDKRVSGDLVYRHDVKRDEIKEQINPDDGKDAAKNGSGNVAAGVANLFTEIDDAVPAVHRVDDRLQTQHDRDGKRPADW